jgi:hypothetical protein
LKSRVPIKEVEKSSEQLAEQVVSVVEAIEKDPTIEKRILVAYISHFYEAIKETIKQQGFVMPYYITLAKAPSFGPLVTDEVIDQAKTLGAKGIVSVEGFQADNDIGDVIYHVTMSAPSIGVLGWVLKVKCTDGRADIVQELPYLFDAPEKVKTLGELVEQMEEESSSITELHG